MSFPFHDLRDDDGHMYRVPIEQVESFKALREEIISTKPRSDKWYDLHAEFDNRFGQYMFE
jgi:hypothetical protein